MKIMCWYVTRNLSFLCETQNCLVKYAQNTKLCETSQEINRPHLRTTHKATATPTCSHSVVPCYTLYKILPFQQQNKRMHEKSNNETNSLHKKSIIQLHRQNTQQHRCKYECTQFFLKHNQNTKKKSNARAAPQKKHQ